MFRKLFIVAMSLTAAGYCFADGYVPQITTSEVYVSSGQQIQESNDFIPAWPIAGSDADVDVMCGDKGCTNTDNIRIISKDGADLIVENTFDIPMHGDFAGWSGGANMLHGNQVPVGFDDECAFGYEMPLLKREVLEDDGGAVLAMSRSGRKNCNKASYLAQAGISEEVPSENEIGVNASSEPQQEMLLGDQVRSWVVANGQTLREVLQAWCDKEGWDLVWTTAREYPIEASAVFKGRFVDVASALVRNFGRATPVPYAKFYNGNRVLVISTSEE